MLRTVCFTGHRPDKLGGYDENNPVAQYVKNELSVVIDAMIAKGYRRFITGGALGVDTWAGELVADYAEWYGMRTDIKIYLELFAPFKGQEAKWFQESKNRYFRLMERCDDVVYVCDDGYATWKMQKRNQAMVDNADVVVAVWDGSSGGTGNCVKYAQSKGKEIILIDPARITRK